MLRNKMNQSYIIISLILIILGTISPASAQNKALTVTDIMKFKEIHHPVISDDGNWIAYTARPDRGDGEVNVHSTKSKTIYNLPRADSPIFTNDARWVAANLLPLATEVEKAKDDKDKPKQGMFLLNTENGDTLQLMNVEKFKFSNDSKWLAVHHFPKKEDKENDKGKKDKKEAGSDLVIYQLDTDVKLTIPFVKSFAFDSTSQYCAYVVSDTAGLTNGLYSINLQLDDKQPVIIDTARNGIFTNLTWNNRQGVLAYTFELKASDGEDEDWSLSIWNPSTSGIKKIDGDDIDKDWFIPSKNEIEWTLNLLYQFMGISKTCVNIIQKACFLEVYQRLTMTVFVNLNCCKFSPCFTESPGNPDSGMAGGCANLKGIFVIVFNNYIIK